MLIVITFAGAKVSPSINTALIPTTLMGNALKESSKYEYLSLHFNRKFGIDIKKQENEIY